MFPYFIFNNINSSDYLIINKLPSIFKAAKDIERIEIPGRDGFLTKDNGTYKSIIKTVECTIKSLDDIDYICSWLTGSGEVIFSNEEDKIYKAVIINQIEFSRIVHTFHKLIIQFECQPFAYSAYEYKQTLTASPAKIFNGGTNETEPIIKIFGTDNVTLNINSQTIILNNIDEFVTVDSGLMDCYKDSMLKNNDMIGEFPKLAFGINTICWTGNVTKIEIKYKEKFL